MEADRPIATDRISGTVMSIADAQHLVSSPLRDINVEYPSRGEDRSPHLVMCVRKHTPGCLASASSGGVQVRQIVCSTRLALFSLTAASRLASFVEGASASG